MAKRKQYEWRITVIRSKGEYLGYVEAPDEQAAMEAAIKEFEVAPHLQKRLIALRKG